MQSLTKDRVADLAARLRPHAGIGAWQQVAAAARADGLASQRVVADLTDLSLSACNEASTSRVVDVALSWLALPALSEDHLGSIALNLFGAVQPDHQAGLSCQLLARLAATNKRPYSFLSKMAEAGSDAVRTLGFLSDPRLQDNIPSYANVGNTLGTSPLNNHPIPNPRAVLRAAVEAIEGMAETTGEAQGHLQRLERFRSLPVGEDTRQRLDATALELIGLAAAASPRDALRLADRALSGPKDAEPLIAAAFAEASSGPWADMYKDLANAPFALLRSVTHAAAENQEATPATVGGMLRGMLGTAHDSMHYATFGQTAQALQSLSAVKAPQWKSLSASAKLILHAVMPAGQQPQHAYRGDESRARATISRACDLMWDPDLESPRTFSIGVGRLYDQLSLHAEDRLELAHHAVGMMLDHERAVDTSPWLRHVELVGHLLECGVQDRNILLGIVGRELTGLKPFATAPQALLHMRKATSALRYGDDIGKTARMLIGQWKSADGLDEGRRVVVETLHQVQDTANGPALWTAAEDALWRPCETGQAAAPGDIAVLALRLLPAASRSQLQQPIAKGLVALATVHGDSELVPPLADQLLHCQDDAQFEKTLQQLSDLRGERYRSAVAINRGLEDGQVQDDGTTVIIGGVRVPKKN